MSALRRFTTNGNTHINGRYCDANEAMKLIEQQAAEIESLKQEVLTLKAHVERLRFIADTEYADEDERIADIQGVLESTPQQNLAEQHPDDEAVNKFAYQMKCKLAIARSKGRSGWDNPDLCTVESLVDMLVEHLQKPNAGNWIDIANFCMMLHLRGANPWLLVNALAEHDAEVAREAIRWAVFEFGSTKNTEMCDDDDLIRHGEELANEYAKRIKDGE